MRVANQIHPITALQSEYSLWEKKPETEILGVCEELGIGFVPYSPLGRGFLSGKYLNTNAFDEGDFRTLLPKFQPENLKNNIKVVESNTKWSYFRQTISR